MALWRTVGKLLLLSVLICTLLRREVSGTLTIQQGRILTSPQVSVELIDVVGIATVELGGNPASRPTYFFECTTNLNNGSGISWTRLSTAHRFSVEDIPNGESSGKRLNVGGIDYPDLDIYTCSDLYSNDVASINITAFNPAIMPAEDSVGVVQGLTVELEVYVSGYPVPTSSHITWYYPNGDEVSDTDTGVEFQDSSKRLILSNVQPQQAGLYECDVILSVSPFLGASTSIMLNVYESSIIVTQPLESIDVLEWTEVILNCSASGNPPPLITWETEGRTQLPVGADTPPPSVNGNTVISLLNFSRVRYEDRGRYRCVADNIETVAAVSQYADIRVSPTLLLEDERMQSVNDLYFVEDESNVRLECYGTGSLQWTSSTGLEIPLASSGNIYQSYDPTRDALSLVIQNFTNITTATYTCMTNLTDAQNNPITVSVLVTSSNPAVIIQSRVQYVLEGRSTTLEARVFASPTESAVVVWYHKGRLIDDANEPQYTATSSGDIHRLMVASVGENEVGEYTIVVTLDGLNATDGIVLNFPEPPSATITPPSITVNEGEAVSIVCEAEGSGPLTVTWTMRDGSPLPMGVQENGNTLVIASAASTHLGTYVCSVRNLAGTDEDEVTLTVFYTPTTIITYNNMTSTDQGLYLIFQDKAPGPTILCSSDGHLPPTVEWIRESGRGLPSGISQIVRSSGEVLLRWQRPMEFTDSGSYLCQSSNNIGNSSASLEVLVQIEPTINSIYPFNSIIEQDSQTHAFTVPVNYVGKTLVCTAKGWPAPEVEWHKDGHSLTSDDGVVSEPSMMSATVSARLTWTRGFTNSDAGNYECVVHKPNTEVALTSQTVYLNAGPPAATLPPVSCSIQEQSIDFQIRVLGTDCVSWNGVRSEDIANELLSVVRTECDCAVEENDLQLLGSAQCSSKIDGAAVFRGHIETSSQEKTEQIFCSLLSWQKKMPLIRINDLLRAVDTTCSLEVNNSPNSEECAVPTDSPSSFGTVEIAITVGAVAGIILVLVIVLIFILIGCCYCHHRSGSKDFGIDAEGSDHTYARTESFSRYGPHGLRTGGMPGMEGEEPVYSTLTQRTMDVPHHTEIIALSQLLSDSSENLIPESVDIGIIPPKMKTAEAYQIPVSSQENLASPAPGSVNNFQAMKRHASTTSGYHSTSHMSNPVQKVPIPRPSNSSTDEGSNVISATSPWNDYEHIDGDDTFSPNSSFCDSPTIPGRVQGRQQSSGSMVGMRISPRSSQRQANAGMSASVPVGINPPQLGPTVFAVVEEDKDEFTRPTGSHQILNNGRPQRTETTTSLQQSHRVGGGSHSPSGSTGSSSPHIMKQTLMTQFQSVDHMVRPRAGRESNCSEAPPPYTSRPSSEAVPNSDSADSSMMDNAAYGGIGNQQRPWYQASDFSLDSSAPSTISPPPNTTKMTGESIQPYAMIHNEHIPYPSHKPGGTKLNDPGAVIMRRSSNNQQKTAFQGQPPVQPYAEPIRSSVASLGHAQDSPTFFEVVV